MKLQVYEPNEGKWLLRDPCRTLVSRCQNVGVPRTTLLECIAGHDLKEQNQKSSKVTCTAARVWLFGRGTFAVCSDNLKETEPMTYCREIQEFGVLANCTDGVLILLILFHIRRQLTLQTQSLPQLNKQGEPHTKSCSTRFHSAISPVL